MPYEIEYTKKVKGSVRWWKWDLEYKHFFFPTVDSEENWEHILRLWGNLKLNIICMPENVT